MVELANLVPDSRSDKLYVVMLGGWGSAALYPSREDVFKNWPHLAQLSDTFSFTTAMQLRGAKDPIADQLADLLECCAEPIAIVIDNMMTWCMTKTENDLVLARLCGVI